MMTATIKFAKTNLSKLVAEAEAGEEVVIMRGTQPVVKLVRIVPDSTPRRTFGALASQVSIGKSFFVPDSVTELAEWES